ncbi:hypothetical protein [Absidia glauca]|uniref:Uncharacterized protein n=1 Tax=Absidia glauca TaxID=4829 RepID=A0A168RJB2_ABSGL|nr:hypothetical protein [Absidia glauca]
MAENSRPPRKRSRGPLTSGDNLPPLSRRRIGPLPANDGQENISLARALFSQSRIPSILARGPPVLARDPPVLARDQVAHSHPLVTRPRSFPPVTRSRPSLPVTRPRPPPTINITRQSLRPRPLPKRRFFGDDGKQ